MPEFEDDMGTTTKRFFHINSSFTSGSMLMNFSTGGSNNGLYISPFLVARRWTTNDDDGADDGADGGTDGGTDGGADDLDGVSLSGAACNSFAGLISAWILL